MTEAEPYEDGYYWVRQREEGTTYVVYHEDGIWWTVGVDHPIHLTDDIIMPISIPYH